MLTDENEFKIHPPLQSFINQDVRLKTGAKVVIDVEPGYCKIFWRTEILQWFCKRRRGWRLCADDFFKRIINRLCPLVYAVWRQGKNY